MNIGLGAKRLLISFMCIFLAFLLLAASMPAKAAEGGSESAARSSREAPYRTEGKTTKESQGSPFSYAAILT